MLVEVKFYNSGHNFACQLKLPRKAIISKQEAVNRLSCSENGKYELTVIPVMNKIPQTKALDLTNAANAEKRKRVLS